MAKTTKIKDLASKLGVKIKEIRSTSTPLSLSTPRRFTHWIVWTALICIVVFLIWAKFAVLEEVTVAEGTVIPLTPIQVISNMEGGIIKSLPVHENDIVEKGQLLVQLDPTRFTSQLDEAKAKAASLQIKIARLNAEVDKTPFKPDATLADAYPNLVKDESMLYQARQDQMNAMQNSYDLAMKELSMTQPIEKQGAASAVDILHLQRQALALKAQITDFYSHALDELNAARGDLDTLNASMLAIQDRLERTSIKSPVKGIIKEIRIPTEGGVVLPGQEIMSVIPIEKNLLVEARVKPAQIGFISIGEPAMVKVTAYDYSIYGGLEGNVKEISADTIKDQQGRSYYLVRIKTDKDYLRTPENPLYIIPGMTATVDILTGRRTVMDYLLAPIIRAKENALRER